MVQFIKETFQKTKDMEMDFLRLYKEMYIKEAFLMIYLKVKESLLGVVGLLLKVNGIRDFNKERDQKNGLMILNMKVILKEEKNMVKENIYGLMEHNIMEIGNMVKQTVLER